MRRAPGIAASLLLALSAGATPAPDFSRRLGALQAEHSTRPTSPEVLFELGHLCHQQAITGDATAVRLAEQYLTRLKQVAPTNAFGRALLGSTLVMKARDAFLPTSKLRWVREGCAEIDAAVQQAPGNPQVRFTRASNNLFLPDICGRKEIVRQDFEWLQDQVGQPVDFRQHVALFHGIALKKWGDTAAAVRRWNDGIALAADSPVAAQIRSALNATRKPGDTSHP